ncbi:Integrase, catalytic core, phage domain protein [Candidatus Omnitrophus magneticus]|uniref:Integrase, catalytic core, phage domain protein n=1 Tax=Candidatus Omnitrophus magneticus TaxID=1609969 RepID=A0A0F0CNB0_9BACT|nr:Integrase, catalytic core, phage domain protein [Candidatus Omnitrophus magneticus]
MCYHSIMEGKFMEIKIKIFQEALKDKVSTNTLKSYTTILRMILDGKLEVKSKARHDQASAVLTKAKEIGLDVDYTLTKWSKRGDKNIKKNIIDKLIDNDKLNKILTACPNTDKGNELRLAILISYNSGLRLSEVLALKPTDIVLNGYIRLNIQGKGEKYRTTYLNKSANINLDNFNGFNINIGYVEANITRIALKTGINFTFHSLRHTFATTLLKGKVSLPKISKLLGHADISTTAIYLHTLDEVDDAMKNLGF